MSEPEKFATGGHVKGPIEFTATVPLTPALARLLANPPEFKGEIKGGRWDGLEVTYAKDPPCDPEEAS